tara:strand:- start:297 stop:524 length:228 start_codon:yes stop_codon:yes gene_type:complete
MSNVNITQNKNTVTVNGETRVVTVKTAGPQGAGFDLSLDHDSKVDNSIMYYQASSGKLILDDNVTKLKLVNGGNF